LGGAVNLSALRFEQEDFTDKVVRVLEDTGLDALNLELEFTESLIMVDTRKSVARLDEFRKLGIKPA
jgi:EAL domain-containing protein (putative c-di-GMP-specific phosphodiesterase class I)